MRPKIHTAIAAILVGAICMAGCKGRAEPKSPEAPTLNVTHWTDRTELYIWNTRPS